MATDFRSGMDAAALREMLDYDPMSGLLIWRHVRGGSPKGSVAGRIGRDGYRYIRVQGRIYMAHRLAWLHAKGCWPSQLIDHRDGDRDNNRIDNLREASDRQNCRNTVRKGYCRHHHGGFRAQIYVNRRQIFLGRFPTEQQARAAYLAATERYFGSFAVTRRDQVSA